VCVRERLGWDGGMIRDGIGDMIKIYGWEWEREWDRYMSIQTIFLFFILIFFLFHS